MAFTFFDDCSAHATEIAGQIVLFLQDNPESLIWKKRNVPRPDLQTADGKALVRDQIELAFAKFPVPKIPGTVPDAAVSHLLEHHYGVDDVDRSVTEHRIAMGAENFIGNALEMYIQSKAFGTSCHLCPQAVVKSVDFVSSNDGGNWVAIQVKNRDNSENSSSASVRKGTEIKKWFRSFSKTGNTNWQNFPEEQIANSLSEVGFQQFMLDYLKHHPDLT